MCLYLTKRGATYYFRRAIPDELQPAFSGKTEFMFSLRTKDREAAKLERSRAALTTDRELEEARARLGLATAAPARSAAPQAPVWPFSEADIEQAELEERDSRAQEARREGRRHLREEWEFLGGSTAEMDPRQAARHDLRREENEDRLTEEGHRLSRMARAVEAAAAPQTAPEAPHSGKPEAQAESLGAFLDTTVVDLWAAERKPKQKGQDTHRRAAEWLYARVGRKPVDQLTKADLLAYKAKLVKEGQSPGNIKMKLSRLRTLLQWATDNGYAETNVAAGVTIKNTDAARNQRKPFDLPALKAIFGSPVYAEGARPTQGRGEAAYWLPLLGLFTGARLEELGQLRPSDVRRETYPGADGEDREAWVIYIKEDAEDDLTLKNADSERRVPVHPELESLGFVAYVLAAQKAKQARLFPLLKPDVYNTLTAKWGEWWSIYRRTVCGVADRRMVFHSFRHTFKDYARHAGIAEGIQRQIMGHSPGDVAGHYGSGYTLHQLVEGMRAYKVPGLPLPERWTQSG